MMTRRLSFRILTMALVTSMAMSFGIPASYAARPTPGGGGSCSGSGCSGFKIDSAGTHLSNSNGHGNLSDYKRVRFDAFSPDAVPVECTDPDTDMYSSIGVPRDIEGPFYIHHRVGVLRTDNKTVVAGADTSLYWNTGLRFNLDTGDTAPAASPTQAPSHDPGKEWVGPHWVNARTYCLPLTGGDSVSAKLDGAQPTLTFKPATRSVVGMKKAKLTIDVASADLTGAISIGFDVNAFWIVGCKANPDPLSFQVCLDGSLFDLTTKGAPITVDFVNSTFVKNSDGSVRATYPLKFRKKGKYIIAALSIFTGVVAVGGVISAVATGLSNSSATTTLNVIDIRSVNRKH